MPYLENLGWLNKPCPEKSKPLLRYERLKASLFITYSRYCIAAHSLANGED